MPIYGAGIIRDANIPSSADIDPRKLLYRSMGVMLSKSNTQAVNNGTVTPVNFDTEQFDQVPSGYTELHNTSSNTSRIILREVGLWVWGAVLTYENKTTLGTAYYAYVTKNGSAVMVSVAHQAVSGVSVSVSLAGLVYAAASTDFLELNAYHGFSPSMNVGNYNFGTFFGAGYLGDIT